MKMHLLIVIQSVNAFFILHKLYKITEENILSIAVAGGKLYKI